MPNLRKTTILGPKKTILAFPDHYVNIPAYVAFGTLASLKDSATGVILAGTIVHLKDTGEVVLPTAALAPNAVVFNEVDPADFESGVDENVNVAALVHGFVRADRLKVLDSANGTVAKLVAANPMIAVVNK